MDVKLPELGEGVTEGELVKYLVAVGDTVSEDQPIAEMMTDKATVEVPSPVSGKVSALVAKEGDTIPVGGVLVQLEAGATGSVSKPSPTTHSAPKSSPTPVAAAAPAPRSASSGGMDVYPPVSESRVLATPSTRRLARELGVDINVIAGTGLAGRVTREDVMKKSGGAGAVSAGLQTPAPGMSIPRPSYQGPSGAQEERVPIRGIRKKIAEKMQTAKHIIPHFTLMEEADVTELVLMRTKLKDAMAAKGVKVTYLPFVMKALIATAREIPEVNCSIDDAAGEIVYKKYFNIGFAADTPNGLLVPVIKDADRKSIMELSQDIVTLSGKAREGKAAPDEMKGATMSITNIGSVGGAYATPIINHPEVMIFGMYKITKRPVWRDGEFEARDIMNVTVTADHRIIDGAVAARFLKAVVARLENPGMLMMDLA